MERCVLEQLVPKKYNTHHKHQCPKFYNLGVRHATNVILSQIVCHNQHISKRYFSHNDKQNYEANDFHDVSLFGWYKGIIHLWFCLYS